MKEMDINVLKFGGTSVADKKKLENVARIIEKRYNAGENIVVVVSAQGKFTDVLVEKAAEISDNPPKRELDVLLSTGEQITISLLAMVLAERKIPAVSLTGWQTKILTDSTHHNARIKKIENQRIIKELKDRKVVVVAGFQGISQFGDITTIGRGGSDTTAVSLAANLSARACDIYTDVDGVYTADPRIVKNAIKIDVISYDEVMEMASLGANVLQNRCVEIARDYNVPLFVKSSFTDNEGTKIIGGGKVENAIVRGVAKDDDVACISLIGIDKSVSEFKVFMLLAEEKINVDIILKFLEDGLANVSFTVSQSVLSQVQEIISANLGALGVREVAYAKGKSKISLVGNGMVMNAGVAARAFDALKENNIRVDMVSTSEIKITLIVDEKQAKKAVQILHKEFLEI